MRLEGMVAVRIFRSSHTRPNPTCCQGAESRLQNGQLGHWSMAPQPTRRAGRRLHPCFFRGKRRWQVIQGWFWRLDRQPEDGSRSHATRKT